MILKTKYHGDINYDESEIIEFPKGVLAFEHLKKFIKFSIEGNEIFQVLHSIEDPATGFVVASPFFVNNNYELRLSDSTLERLKIDSPENVLVLGIVNVNSDMKKTTINLRAPVIINIKEKLGEQIILGTEKYKIKTPIVGEEK
ncbi:flagellar assembly protein FliW [Hathewaya limosa]|uniref:Flagellar assembly factor FliW n=1 Tax=Hathewaya limosa TaxID=1536 RepID=A0ABU0JT25_HATLI|nr:flagellar assembly protein FliW [Hathewaya limosa]MDQ0479229.1 flagellar assembly factor FliW [Hathewaya limosa]